MPDLACTAGGLGDHGRVRLFRRHGTALVAADAFEQLGIEGTREIAVTPGYHRLITAMVLGMVVVNFGIRKAGELCAVP